MKPAVVNANGRRQTLDDTSSGRTRGLVTCIPNP